MTTNTTTDTAATIGVGGVAIETTPRTAITGEMQQQHTKYANHADENKHGMSLTQRCLNVNLNRVRKMALRVCDETDSN